MSPKINPRYVEREAELEDFEQILTNPYGERRVKYIWGPGGIGKTWLAKSMLEEASEKGLLTLGLIDMYFTDVRYSEGIMNEIIDRLKEQVDASLYAEYQEAKRLLAQARSREDYSLQGLNELVYQLEVAFRRSLEKITDNIAVVLAIDTFEHVRHLSVGRWILDDEGLQMPGLVCIIAGRPDPQNPPDHELAGFSDAEALQLYHTYTHDRELTASDERFLKQLNAKVKGNPLLLGLAVIWRDLGEFETERLGTSIENFEKRLVWPLRSTEGSGSRALGNIRLDEPMYQTLVFMAYLNRRFNKFFFNKLVENGYVRLRHTTQDEVWQELQKDHLFFVKRRSGDVVQLHDELAEMFKTYLLSDVFDDRDEQPGDKWIRFTEQVVEWYDELIAQDVKEHTRAYYKVEKLGYVLQRDAPKERRRPNMTKAKRLVTDYIREHTDILHKLLSEETGEDFVDLFALEDQYELATSLATMAMRINRVSKSYALWEKAVGVAQKIGDPCAEIDAFVGPNKWPGDPEYCLRLLKRAKSLSEEHCPEKLPEVIYGLGFAYRRKQNLNKAITLYHEAFDAASKQKNGRVIGIVLNDMGYIYLLTGEYDKAMANIRKGRAIRMHRFKALHTKRERECRKLGIPKERMAEECDFLRAEIQEAAWMSGLSYNTLGEMLRYTGDMPKAIQYYQEALSFFDEAEDMFWKMTALFSLGEAERRYAMIKKAAGLTRSAQEFDQKAEKHITESLEICEEYGFIESKDTASRRMGRLLHDRGLRAESLDEKEHHYTEALQYFKEGLQIALSTGDVLEELENLNEIAFIADDMLQVYLQVYGAKQPLILKAKIKSLEQFIIDFEEGIKRHAQDPNRIFRFGVFPHLLEIERGAFEFVQGNYDLALQLYLDGFTGLASDPGYGRVRFHQHSGHLLQQMRSLPTPDMQDSWYSAFQKRWTEPNPGYGGQVFIEVDAVEELLYDMYLDVETAFIVD
jgi:tetratricopeptide (TPR) repeat protein